MIGRGVRIGCVVRYWRIDRRHWGGHQLLGARDVGLAAGAGQQPLCRGLLSGKLQTDTQFQGDDLRLTDPKLQPPLYAQYLAAVRRLDQFARDRYGKRAIHLAVRWILDQGATTALWGARHPGQLEPVDEVFGWSLDTDAKVGINRILRESIPNPVGPEFMAPPRRHEAMPERQIEGPG